MHRSFLHRILNKNLKLHCDKIQLMQDSIPNDSFQRLEFVKQAIERLQTFSNILLSDEGHFHLNVHVNKQYCRYWNATNPKCKHPKLLHAPLLLHVVAAVTFLKMKEDLYLQ